MDLNFGEILQTLLNISFLEIGSKKKSSRRTAFTIIIMTQCFKHWFSRNKRQKNPVDVWFLTYS